MGISFRVVGDEEIPWTAQPFVPATTSLSRLATNALKHFKHEVRGTRAGEMAREP